MRKDILSLTLEELQEYLSENNEPKFRAKQIFTALHSFKKIDDISNIPKALKEKIKEDFETDVIAIEKQLISKDGTRKFLYRLCDNNIIEGVLMAYEYGNTLCVSTQVGCRMGCEFCASTKNGLVRNLTAGEILGQVLCVNNLIGGTREKRQITNVVLMGSGEPLDNYDNVTKFFELVNDENGICISERNISLSTCGIVPNMKKLADDGFTVTLTISLHNTQDDKRELFMPITKKYKINEVIDAAKYYFKKTGRRVIFEYSVIANENDSKEDAMRLKELLKGLSAHVNIIVLNEIKERKFNKTTKKDAYRFLGLLEEQKLSASVRRQMGVDINGACGQLRRDYLGGN